MVTELSDDILKQVEDLAGLFYTPKQVALICEIPANEFETAMSNESSALYKAYWKGYFTAEIEFRKEVKKASNYGSSPAQTLLAKIIENHKLQSIGE